MERRIPRAWIGAAALALWAAGCGSAPERASKEEAAMAARTASTPAEATSAASPSARLETATFSLG